MKKKDLLKRIEELEARVEALDKNKLDIPVRTTYTPAKPINPQTPPWEESPILYFQSGK